jgi:HEAT repeat protein
MYSRPQRSLIGLWENTSVGKEIRMARLRQLLLFVTLLLPACAKTEKPEPIYEGRSLAGWIALLGDPNPHERMNAARALQEMGPLAEPAVPQLIGSLKDKAKRVCGCAIKMLGAIGPKAEAAVPPLMTLLSDRECGLPASNALGRIGQPALQPLLDTLNDENAQVRSHAINAIGKMGPNAKVALAPLMEKLKDSNALIRSAAAHALGDIGPEARVAEKPLHELLKDEDPGVRIVANTALARIDPEYAPMAVATLIVALKDKDLSLRGVAVASLGRIGPAAEAGVPSLLELLHERQTDWIEKGQICSVSAEVAQEVC